LIGGRLGGAIRGWYPARIGLRRDDVRGEARFDGTAKAVVPTGAQAGQRLAAMDDDPPVAEKSMPRARQRLKRRRQDEAQPEPSLPAQVTFGRTLTRGGPAVTAGVASAHLLLLALHRLATSARKPAFVHAFEGDDLVDVGDGGAGGRSSKPVVEIGDVAHSSVEAAEPLVQPAPPEDRRLHEGCVVRQAGAIERREEPQDLRAGVLFDGDAVAEDEIELRPGCESVDDGLDRPREVG